MQGSPGVHFDIALLPTTLASSVFKRFCKQYSLSEQDCQLSCDGQSVVARFNEDVSWLLKVPNNIKITLYNKGKDLKLPSNIKQIKLENKGRESHTIAYHCLYRYDSLSDYTIFCQGDPFCHSPHFLKLLELHDLASAHPAANHSSWNLL